MTGLATNALCFGDNLKVLSERLGRRLLTRPCSER